jgi:hypothetical protein
MLALWQESGVLEQTKNWHSTYQNTDLITDVSLRRLEWLYRLIRTEINRTPKSVLDAQLDGKRKVGRPKLRWSGDIQADLKVTGNKEWTRKAQDRSECMDVIRKAEVKLRGV